MWPSKGTAYHMKTMLQRDDRRCSGRSMRWLGHVRYQSRLWNAGNKAILEMRGCDSGAISEYFTRPTSRRPFSIDHKIIQNAVNLSSTNTAIRARPARGHNCTAHT